MEPDYDWPDHLGKHFEFIWTMGREVGIRSGQFAPRTDAERRQAAEGPLASRRDLDCFREPQD